MIKLGILSLLLLIASEYTFSADKTKARHRQTQEDDIDLDDLKVMSRADDLRKNDRKTYKTLLRNKKAVFRSRDTKRAAHLRSKLIKNGISDDEILRLGRESIATDIGGSQNPTLEEEMFIIDSMLMGRNPEVLKINPHRTSLITSKRRKKSSNINFDKNIKLRPISGDDLIFWQNFDTTQASGIID
jgi:hypothetical protein